MKTALLPLLAACLLPAMAAEKLAPGMPAPPLVSGEFIQGEPVKEFEKDKVYVVEFWATWCGPCVATIPHVNDLQKKFADKGLVVIGQNVWERDTSKVKPFVEKMGEKMTYRVAMDDKSDGGKGKMAETWMQAAGQKGIPSAFVVDKKGSIAWIGHPARLNEELLGQIIDGTFDPAAYAEKMKK
jgi:thiol-disulfide isomerase/thioredoxin